MKNIYQSKKIEKVDKKAYKQINTFIYHNLISNSEKKREWKIGYETFGIFLVGFCQWLHKNISENKIEKIYFLARDGYIVKKAYEILYHDAKTNYLYVSRKSLALPSMKNTKKDTEILASLVLPPMFTIKEFLESLDIDFEEKKDIIENCGIKENDIFYRNTYKTEEKINLLIKKLREDIRKKIDEQYDIFTKYLQQEEFSDKVAIVDIGWHNSIQKYFKKIMDCYAPETKIYGYYVGIYKDAVKFTGNHQAKGYLYEYDTNSKEQYKTFAFVSLFESMFLAHEGTTLKYTTNNEIAKPKIAQYEYRNDSQMVKIISEFQEGAIQFVKDYIENDNIRKIELNNRLCSYNLINFGLNPKKEDIKIFGSLSFENFTNNQMINYNHGFLYYIFHLKELKGDFYKSGWRIIFLKKLIKFPFPHFQFFKVLCKIFL